MFVSPAPRVTLSIAKESPEGSAGESPAAPKVTSTGLSPRVRLRLTPPARDLGNFNHPVPDEARCLEATEAEGRRLLPLSSAGVTEIFVERQRDKRASRLRAAAKRFEANRPQGRLLGREEGQSPL